MLCKDPFISCSHLEIGFSVHYILLYSTRKTSEGRLRAVIGPLGN